MANKEKPPQLFTEDTTPGSSPGHVRSWKDEAVTEAVHGPPGDPQDRLDTQAQTVAGADQLVASGKSRREAGRILNARAAQDHFESSRAAAEAEQASAEAARAKREVEMGIEVLRSTQTD